MRITVTVAEQLRLLHEDSAEDDGDLVEGLGRLARDVALAVPSSLAVTILLAGPDREVSVSAQAEPAPVRASLAVRLSAGEPSDLVILRAATAGAFLLLADDLTGPLGSDHPPAVLDGHLSWPALGSESLADLRSINQAVGVLVDRGLPPAEARGELQRRATAAGASVAAVSRDLLGSLWRGSHPAPPEDRAGTAER